MEVIEIVGLILLVIGFLLVGIEMMLPGFGISGISGIVCLTVGTVMTAKTVSDGIVMAIVIIVILAIMLVIAMTILGSKKMKHPIVLRDDVKGEQGFLNSSDLEYLIGKEGVTVTDLRPSGKGSFDGVDLDILSEGKFITQGKRIRITKVRDNKFLVKEAE